MFEREQPLEYLDGHVATIWQRGGEISGGQSYPTKKKNSDLVHSFFRGPNLTTKKKGFAVPTPGSAFSFKAARRGIMGQNLA